MSIHKKIALATLITLGMAACGGGGSGSPSTAATSHADIQGVKAALAAENTNKDKEEAKKTSQNLSDYTVTLAGVQHNVGKMAKNELVEGVNGKEAFRAYRQAYSVVAGSFALQSTTGGDPDDNSPDMKMPMQIKLINGEATQTLPTAGKYTYNGAAFSNSETGRLTYNVDFDKKVGSGAVTGLAQIGDVKLDQAELKHTNFSNPSNGSLVLAHGVEGTVSKDKELVGDYHVHLFGPNAEEVAGMVLHHKAGEIGVIGKRD